MKFNAASVLAIVTLSFFSMSAQAKRVGFVVKPISLTAFVQDDSDTAANVRRTPPSGQVKLTLANEEIVHIVGQTTIAGSTWFLINRIDSFGDDEAALNERLGGSGWMHHSRLAVDSAVYDPSQTVSLYERADASSRVVGSLGVDQRLKFSEADGAFIKVRLEQDGQPVEGWVEKQWICGNPVTNCS